MFQNKKILALIPARGGSKGLSRKNIKLLSGKPLIAWTIERARNSKYIDEIVVSTDDEEIAEVSKQYGAEIPFLRPEELATDEAKGVDVALHAVERLKTDGRVYDLLILLQPTSPLRVSEDIDKAIELLFSKSAKAVVSVHEIRHHSYKANNLPEDGCMKDFIRPEAMNKNRQDLPVFYGLNGAIYLAYCDYMERQKSFFGNETFAYIMPRKRSVDIDDEIDFKMAETLLES